MPYDSAETAAGAAIAHAFAALGGALILWLPAMGALWVAQRARRKTH